jgi:hypothetical protein
MLPDLPSVMASPFRMYALDTILLEHKMVMESSVADTGPCQGKSATAFHTIAGLTI